MAEHKTQRSGSPELLERIEVKEPRRVKVILHNDDYTSMEFVVSILVEIFHKNLQQATAIMLAVHEQGRGECGRYTIEVAETKAAQVHGRARQAGFPLRCSLEDI